MQQSPRFPGWLATAVVFLHYNTTSVDLIVESTVELSAVGAYALVGAFRLAAIPPRDSLAD